MDSDGVLGMDVAVHLFKVAAPRVFPLCAPRAVALAKRSSKTDKGLFEQAGALSRHSPAVVFRLPHTFKIRE